MPYPLYKADFRFSSKMACEKNGATLMSSLLQLTILRYIWRIPSFFFQANSSFIMSQCDFEAVSPLPNLRKKWHSVWIEIKRVIQFSLSRLSLIDTALLLPKLWTRERKKSSNDKCIEPAAVRISFPVFVTGWLDEISGKMNLSLDDGKKRCWLQRPRFFWKDCSQRDFRVCEICLINFGVWK